MPDVFLQEATRLGGSNTPGPDPRKFLAVYPGRKDTSDQLSIHHFSIYNSRNPDTVILEYYVCRMGVGEYVLMKCPGNSVQSDFFSEHDYLFPPNLPRLRYFSEASERDLLAFSLMRTGNDEQALANLLLATGTLCNALGVERPFSRVMPSTSKAGASTDFMVKNHEKNGNDYRFNGSGQVEADLIVSGMKNNRVQLFVIESKTKGNKDISNHKFLYPAAQLYQTIFDANPEKMEYTDIIPAYLHCFSKDGLIHFELAVFDPIGNAPVDLVRPSFRSQCGDMHDPSS